MQGVFDGIKDGVALRVAKFGSLAGDAVFGGFLLGDDVDGFLLRLSLAGSFLVFSAIFVDLG